MKPLILALFLLSSVAGAQEALVRVKNPAPFDRERETIEVGLSALKRAGVSSPFAVFEGERLILSQVIAEPSDAPLLIFQSGFRAGEKKTFTVRHSPGKGSDEGASDAKFILPRRDVAWENDRIAFRIYGGPLAGDVRDGLDVWVKRVRYHIIDKWYDGDSLRGAGRISYHVDHGEGADFFNVGRSLGAGGCALYSGGALHQAGLFTDYRIISRGPIRSIFTVHYASDPSNGLNFPVVKTYSLDAGENLNRIDVSSGGAGEMAAGLVKRAGVVRYADEKLRWLSLWGRTDDDSTTGSLGTGLVVTAGSFSGLKEDKDHYLIVMKASPGKTLRYYAGAGWSRSGDFTDVTSWNDHLAAFARRLEYPLEIGFGAGK